MIVHEKNTGQFTDSRDGQKYRTVTIGGKTWMAQNLNYRSGTGNFWCYGDDSSNRDKYGMLYDWDAAKAACPAGWHLPTQKEWNDLTAAAGGSVAGKELKAASGWNDNDGGADEHGFSALPGGHRRTDGGFDGMGDTGVWWTATDANGVEALCRIMRHGYDSVHWYSNNKKNGFSVRCVQDD
jgi:uncharacterized protein (TIGR02145 family)